jgi:hypothetical protein
METKENMGQAVADASPLTPPTVRRRINPGQRMRVRKTLTGEAVPTTGYHYKQQHVLASTLDEVETQLSLATYDRMENDPTIAKDKKILITSVLSDELQLSPRFTEDTVGSEEFDTSVEIMEFCERLWQGLETDGRDTLEQQFGNALKYGHGLAEIEWEYREDAPSSDPPADKSKAKASLRERFFSFFMGQDEAKMAEPERPALKGKKLRLMPKKLMVKPRGAAQFVVDDYMNILGLITKRNFGVNPSLRWDEMWHRNKFMVLTLNKQNEDPRGKSTYRPAYNWYNLKVQIPAEMLRYILEEITPKGIATLPPEGKPYEQATDADGNPLFEDDGVTPKMITIVQSFMNAMEGFTSGSNAVIPHESKIEPYRKGLTGSNDANLFKAILKIVDDQIENSILNQTMAQSEGENQGRSASQQVAEILYVLQFWYRWQIAQMIVKDLFAPAILLNYGEWALRYLPVASLGDFARRDWVEDLLALADAYFKGFIDDSQRAELMAWMNLPKPGKSRQEMEMENGAKLDANGNPVQTNSQRPDKQAGSENRNAGNGTEKGVKKRNRNGRSKSDMGVSPLNLLGHHRGSLSRFTGNLFRR